MPATAQAGQGVQCSRSGSTSVGRRSPGESSTPTDASSRSCASTRPSTRALSRMPSSTCRVTSRTAHDDRRGRRRRRGIHRPRSGHRHPRAQHRVAQRAAEGDPRGADRRAGHDRERRERGRLGRVPLRCRPRRRPHGHAHDGHRRRRCDRRSTAQLFRGGHGIAARTRSHALHPRRPAVRLRAERMPRAVRIRTRTAARGERDRGCRRHRRRARRRARRRRARSAARRSRGSCWPATPGAVEALRRVATALGEACGGFQAVLDPELFVIGGGVAQLGEDLLAPGADRVRDLAAGLRRPPDRGVRDRPARQRRRAHRRGRPRDPGARQGAHRRCSTG